MTRTVTWHKDTHADVSAPSRPLALISILSFCGVLYASLFIIYLRIKNAAGASSIPRPRKEDDHKDTCDGTNCQPGAGPQGHMHTARHVFLISAPPLLRLLSLISTVCNATAFSQARRVHEHLSMFKALLGAGRDNSTHKERHDRTLSLLPAELLVYWRRGTYQSFKEKHICGKA